MTRTQAGLIWISFATSSVTGTALGVMKYLVRSDDPYAVVNHPWQPWALSLHVVTTPLLVFGLGAIATDHVVARWRSRQPVGRRSGIAMASAAAPMVLSGYLVQVTTHPHWLRGAVVAHVATSVLFVVVMTTHLGVTWKRARALRAARSWTPGPEANAGASPRARP